MKKIRKFLSKINFELERNPVIENMRDYRKFIPEPFSSVVTITADFELAWSSRYTKNYSDPYRKAIENAKRARKNIPNILKLCDEYNIPVTWATVGHLFLKECKRINGVAHPELKRLPHFENKFWKFDNDDWFQHDPCTNWEEAPEWYAPDLIKQIIEAKVKHEIGCHTFSHIDCSDQICSYDVFESEINKCIKLAKKYGIDLKSFVHPGHTIGNLNSLKKLCFISFQTDYNNTLGYPKKYKNGLWELKRTMEFIYCQDWPIKYHIYRYKKIIDRAIKYNTLCNFWFHPSINNKFIQEILPEIFYFIKNKNILAINIKDYIEMFL